MSKKQVNDVELFYEEWGTGEDTIVFSHGYLMDHTMFQGQIDVFKEQFRCVAYDHRSHGRSQTITEPYTIDAIVNDAIAFIESLAVGPVHFVGMSTGGFVGLRVALRRPDLLKSLVLMDTSAEPDDAKTLNQYNLLLKTVQTVGWRLVIGQVMSILFGQTFLDNPQRKDDVKKWRGIITGHERKGMVVFGKAIFSRDDVLPQLAKLSVPTVVIVGKDDAATPLAMSQRMADRIPDCRLRIVPDAGHSAAVERPQAVAEAMQLFYERVGIM